MTQHQQNPQQPSGMPHARYEPFIPVDLVRPHVADAEDHRGAALVRGRPA